MADINLAGRVNNYIRNCKPHLRSAQTCKTIREAFMRDDFMKVYEDASVVYTDQPTYVAHAKNMRQVFKLPLEEGEIISVTIDPECIPILRSYRENLVYAQGARMRNNTGKTVLEQFLEELKHIDSSLISEFIESKKAVETANGKHPFMGVVWQAIDSGKEYSWLTQPLKNWAKKRPAREANPLGNQAQHHLVDYVVNALELLYNLQSIHEDKSKGYILSKIQMISAVASVGQNKENFLKKATAFKFGEDWLAKGNELHTEGHVKTLRRTMRSVALITLTIVTTPASSIFLNKDAMTLRAIVAASTEQDKNIELHHMCKGSLGVLWQHNAKGNAMNVRFVSGHVPVWNGESTN